MQHSYRNESDGLVDSPSYKNNKPEELELKQIDEADDISDSLEDHELYAVVEKTHQRRSVPLSEFVDYVNKMHGNIDALFEKEFDVRIGVATCMYLLLFPVTSSLSVQIPILRMMHLDSSVTKKKIDSSTLFPVSYQSYNFYIIVIDTIINFR